jgi:SPP1 gp7 family putative phage head morphogenesis protein
MKIPRIRFPNGQTKDYFTRLTDLIDKMHGRTVTYINSYVISNLNTTGDSSRADTWIDDVINGLNSLDEQARKLFTEEIGKKLAEDFIGKVKTWGTIEVGRQVKAVLGFDPMARSPKLSDTVKAAVQENVSLIKSIPEQYHARIENIVLTGVRSGKSGKQLTEDIEAVYNVTKERAKLIAVDQAGKMLGDVTRIRHTEMGLQNFRWRSSKDNRVRPKHQAWDGQIFSWESGAPGGVFPGQEVRCRCTADVLEDELLDNFDPIPEKSAQAKTAYINNQKNKTPFKSPTKPTAPPIELPKVEPIPTAKGPETWTEYKPFETRAAAADWARQFVAEKVDYGNMSLTQVNEANRALFDMVVKPKRKKLTEFVTHANEKSSPRAMAHVHHGENGIHFLDYGIGVCKHSDQWKEGEQAFIMRLKDKDGIKEKLREQIAKYEQAAKDETGTYWKNYVKGLKKRLKQVDTDPVIFRWTVGGSDTYQVIVHEFGHVVHNRYGRKEVAMAIGLDPKPSKARFKKSNGAPLTKKTEQAAFNISEYAGANVWEYFAESWAAYHIGGWERNRLPMEMIKLIETIINSGTL